MAQIQAANLTFAYEGSPDNIFENVSFCVDTDWKLGLIGRNGKGKTTFLQLLAGKYDYSGKITAPAGFDYFPYEVTDLQRKECASDFLEMLKPGCEEWRVMRELARLDMDPGVLYQPFEHLSHGQQTRLLLAVLFSGEQDFLLIDEPTNHLDQESRECVKKYLQGKKGYILVSHDRDLLDACADHVLVLNRKTIQVQSGNFSQWWEDKSRKDSFARKENEKHLKEIASLKRAADQSSRWAEKNESMKIGYDPIENPDHYLGTRAYIGAKTKKMQSRVTQYKRRMERAIEEKEGLLQDIENPAALKLNPLTFHKERLITCRDLSVRYDKDGKDVLKGFCFELMQGERVFLHGGNGCGKSTFIKTLLKYGKAGTFFTDSTGEHMEKDEKAMPMISQGELMAASNLVISYINQDTRCLHGDVRDFCEQQGLEESLFFALLRKLDMEREQFTKKLEDFSEGQKKKVLIAASLLTPAHVYIWDEPLNYVDVFSRIQLEELLLKYKPTMILVEHDVRFRERIATRVAEM